MEEVEFTAAHSIPKVEERMNSRKLGLARHKTEVMVVNNRKTQQRALILVGDYTIESKRYLKHLGVMIDDKLSFASHVEYACKRASTVIAVLSRMMSNNSAVIARKRKPRLPGDVALSILSYGGPIWSKALRTSRNLKRLESRHQSVVMFFHFHREQLRNRQLN